MTGADIAIETLAASEAALLEQVKVLRSQLALAESARDGYRVVALEATARMCELRSRLDALEERYHRALDEARRLRVDILQRAA